MSASVENIYSSTIMNSNTHLTDNAKKKTLIEKWKRILKVIKLILKEASVEPCLFIYMACVSMSSLTVQNMHLEKSCRVNFHFDNEVCDRIKDRNTTGLEEQLKDIQSLVAKVVAWKFPLQTGIPAVMVLFIGAWSDKYKKRKICIIVPMIGEIVVNIGLLFATYYFYEISLIETALIEALPAALTGSYIVIFMGMFSYVSDRTTVEERTFRLGIVSICVSLGSPTGLALSGVLLNAVGYYGMFSLLLFLHVTAVVYGMYKLEDVMSTNEDNWGGNGVVENKYCALLCDVVGLVAKTVNVALVPRAFRGRTMIFCIIILYLLMVGPLYGDSQVAYLYSIRKFALTTVQYSLFSTINTILGLVGVMFCISVLSKKLHMQDSVIGGIACTSRIASCIVMAFAPSASWFFSATLFNIFSHSGLTAIRSIASKSVPSEEYAKINSLIGVTEALAPTIYMPTSSAIYIACIDNFPGAFYMFDATLTALAIGLFIIVYFLVKRKEAATVTNINRKNEFVRTNEALTI